MRQNLNLAFVFASCFVFLSCSSSRNPSITSTNVALPSGINADQQITILNRELLEAVWDKNTEQLNYLLADSFVSKKTDDSSMNKSQIIDSLKNRAPGVKDSDFTNEQVQVNVIENSAICTGRVTLKDNNTGQELGSQRYQSKWLKNNGAWLATEVLTLPVQTPSAADSREEGKAGGAFSLLYSSAPEIRLATTVECGFIKINKCVCPPGQSGTPKCKGCGPIPLLCEECDLSPCKDVGGCTHVFGCSEKKEMGCNTISDVCKFFGHGTCIDLGCIGSALVAPPSHGHGIIISFVDVPQGGSNVVITRYHHQVDRNGYYPFADRKSGTIPPGSAASAAEQFCKISISAGIHCMAQGNRAWFYNEEIDTYNMSRDVTQGDDRRFKY
jgi:hypothetical protein